MRNAKVSAGILLAVLFHNPGEAHGQTTPDSYHATLAWDAHPDPAVTGFRVHYGTASGNYTDSITVADVTTTTVPGLEDGVTYFFAITALNTDGLESGFSNEISFQPGQQEANLSIGASGGIVLTITGLIGQQYDIEATQDLKTWILISTVMMGDGGTLKFSDPDAAFYRKRFYRIRQTP